MHTSLDLLTTTAKLQNGWKKHMKSCAKPGNFLWRHGYFQSAFMQYINQKNNVLENYSYEVYEEIRKIRISKRDYIVIGSEKYELT